MTRKWLTNDADYKQLHRRTELLAKHCSLMTPSHAQVRRTRGRQDEKSYSNWSNPFFFWIYQPGYIYIYRNVCSTSWSFTCLFPAKDKPSVFLLASVPIDSDSNTHWRKSLFYFAKLLEVPVSQFGRHCFQAGSKGWGINPGGSQGWISGSGGVSSDNLLVVWQTNKDTHTHIPTPPTFFFVSHPVILRQHSLSKCVCVCVCFLTTGVCESAALARGEGIRGTADEEKLFLQEPKTRESSSKDLSAVGGTRRFVWGNGKEKY